MPSSTLRSSRLCKAHLNISGHPPPPPTAHVVAFFLAKVLRYLAGCGRGPLQDEDHSGSRPHSFPGLFSMGSERPPERPRSGPAVTGSRENRRDVLGRLVCGFPFYWTPLTTFLWPVPQFPQKLELFSLPAISEHSSFVPSCS